MRINFVYQNEFLLSKNTRKLIREVIRHVAQAENKEIQIVNLIFCGDKLIREFNRKYLNHDYETDIITFHDLNEDGAAECELMVSTDTVKINSDRFNAEFEDELLRVIIHGILHLCGYNDLTKADKSGMRKRENYYLKLKYKNAG